MLRPQELVHQCTADVAILDEWSLVIQTAQLISAMVKSHGHVSDLIFSPGRAPQIEMNGQLVEFKGIA